MTLINSNQAFNSLIEKMQNEAKRRKQQGDINAEVNQTCKCSGIPGLNKRPIYCCFCGLKANQRRGKMQVRKCPFCGTKPRYDKDMKLWYCPEEECPIYGILMTKKQWNT